MKYCLFRKSSHTLFIRKVEAGRKISLSMEETKLTAETQIWGPGISTIARDSMLVHKNVRNF